MFLRALSVLENGMCSSGIVFLARRGIATSRLCGLDARAVCFCNSRPFAVFCSQFKLSKLWLCILNICCEFIYGLIGRSVSGGGSEPAVQLFAPMGAGLCTIPDRWGYCMMLLMTAVSCSSPSFCPTGFYTAPRPGSPSIGTWLQGSLILRPRRRKPGTF